MKFKYCFLLLLNTFFLSFYIKSQDCIIKNEYQQNTNSYDTIIKIPILEITDSSFYYVLTKIAKFKNNKKIIYKNQNENFAVVRIAYFTTDIYIESLPRISLLLYEGASIPKGIIQIEGCDFLLYDQYDLALSYIKKTTLFKSYEFQQDESVGYEEFDSWSFNITDLGIELVNFYPREEIYKDLFFEIYNK